MQRVLIWFISLALLAVSAQRWLHDPSLAQQAACAATPDAPISIPLTTLSTPLPLNLSTNFDDATQLDPQVQPRAAETLRLLKQWNPPFVRLHFGFRSEPPSLPEAEPGQWDFTLPDAAISNLRAAGMSYVLNVRSAPPWMFNSVGQLRDKTYHEFAQYMARLVGWYNKGGFTDDAGHFHASGHQNWVHDWEVWNEPNSGYEIPAPVSNPSATWMQPGDFARLYSAAVHAMLVVDPTIIVGGPAMSPGGQVDYLNDFLRNVYQPLDFVSFHYYPTGDKRTPDQAIFDGVNNELLDRIQGAKVALRNYSAHPPPLWLDEVNLNEGTLGDIDPRATAPLGYAFVADTFGLSVQQHLSLSGEFEFLSNAQGGLVNITNDQPFRSYWLYQLLGRAFPVGAHLLAVAAAGDLTMVAALAPDHQSVYVLLGNAAVAHPWDVNGAGVARTVCLNMVDLGQHISIPTGDSATVWHFDARTSPTAMPTPVTEQLLAGGQPNVFWQTTLGGYGATVVKIPVFVPFTLPFAV